MATTCRLHCRETDVARYRHGCDSPSGSVAHPVFKSFLSPFLASRALPRIDVPSLTTIFVLGPIIASCLNYVERKGAPLY